MKQADIQLRVDKFGSTVPLTGVTPAEVLYLVADNHRNAGTDPIVELKEKGEAMTYTGEEDKTGKPVLRPRSPSEEIARLRMKYPEKTLSKLFGGFNPRMPETFEEARQAGLGISIPSNNLINHNLLA